MPHSFGYRARTRHLFARPNKKHGLQTPSKAMTVYHMGDLVDIVTDGAVHKGMPYKVYHGKTGRIFSVCPRGIGVEINKRVRHRIMKKRLYIRHEHIRKSNCREAFLRRLKEDLIKKQEAKKEGKIISTKRIPPQPRAAHIVKNENVEFVNPLRFKDIF
uniref:60S ribosomal protein L21 n=2 Tax=Euplotes harpa TaxID=151035 RepID=A0A7S3J180_9SPIT|mmetsp:Transcript_11274/g.12733  ORF Transcript_11274/g.12733 Transcript_11274/m.12733 type:complete len:159 (+) Transcript_11274:30-506(+)